jgi:hypothetical protein
MLDLFLRPTVPMYKSRAEKEFDIKLNHLEIIDNRMSNKKNPIENVSIGLYEKELNLAY